MTDYADKTQYAPRADHSLPTYCLAFVLTIDVINQLLMLAGWRW